MAPRSGSTRLRLMALLTLALLPLGLGAVYLSWTLSQQARETSERALLGETIRAAAAQREVLQTVIGQASALAHILRPAVADPEACAGLLQRFAEGAPAVRYAALARADGTVICATGEGPGTLPAALTDGQRRLVDARATAASEGLDGMVYSQPVAVPDTAARPVLIVSIRRAALTEGPRIPGLQDWPLSLVTFDGRGRIVFTATPPDTVARKLPEGRPLSGFVGAPAHAFSARAAGGETRVFSVVPILAGELYALGTWPPDILFGERPSPLRALGLLLPLLMWGVTLAVAYVAIQRMVLRPLGALQTRMQAFSEGRRLLPAVPGRAAPDELRDVAESFEHMTRRIVADEARLESALHEQEVLLKEVHHRVKNNLQLIASILNMQIRQQPTPEARQVLRRVQDRVMGLASVHQHLYRAPALSGLRADALLREIVDRRLNQAGSRGLRVEAEYAPLTLYPDQAVPLALLVNEAVTNALDHLGAPEGGAPWLRLALAEDRAGRAVLAVANSTAPSVGQAAPLGLGARLIDAFAEQLGAEVARETPGRAHVLRLSFAVTSFESQGGA